MSTGTESSVRRIQPPSPTIRRIPSTSHEADQPPTGPVVQGGAGASPDLAPEWTYHSSEEETDSGESVDSPLDHSRTVGPSATLFPVVPLLAVVLVSQPIDPIAPILEGVPVEALVPPVVSTVALPASVDEESIGSADFHGYDPAHPRRVRRRVIPSGDASASHVVPFVSESSVPIFGTSVVAPGVELVSVAEPIAPIPEVPVAPILAIADDVPMGNGPPLGGNGHDSPAVEDSSAASSQLQEAGMTRYAVITYGHLRYYSHCVL